MGGLSGAVCVKGGLRRRLLSLHADAIEYSHVPDRYIGSKVSGSVQLMCDDFRQRLPHRSLLRDPLILTVGVVAQLSGPGSGVWISIQIDLGELSLPNNRYMLLM